jgi:hypothetical protein
MLALREDQRIQPIHQFAGTCLGGVLVGERGPHRGVPHPLHQLARRGAGLGHEVVSGVPQIVLVPTSA